MVRAVAEGVEARLATADPTAASEAEADRQALLSTQGADVNHAEVRIERIRSRVE